MPASARRASFRSAEDMLEAGLQLVRARLNLREAEEGDDKQALRAANAAAKAWTACWHAAFRQSVETVPLAKHLELLRLNQIEREIVLVLLLSNAALLPKEVGTVEDVLASLHLAPREVLKALRCLGEDGRLVSSGLVGMKDNDDLLPQRTLVLDPTVVELAIHGRSRDAMAWPVKSQEDAMLYMERLSNALRQKVDQMDDVSRGFGSTGGMYMWQRRAAALLKGLEATLAAHPDWPLAKLCQATRSSVPGAPGVSAWTMLVALLGKELGHVAPEDGLFSGQGLARAASCWNAPVHRNLSLLSSASYLRTSDWVRPCGGADSLISDSEHDVCECEYELTPHAADFLGLKACAAGKRRTKVALLTPRIRLNDLVLPAPVHEALQTALAHARHADVLYTAWGLGERIAYGRGAVLLFCGPPGTGKTAAAEALANELEKPLLVADYAKIQNCFVGQTEKNIARMFRDARASDAVLFWDEADAMFFDRDAASRTWEVRDVNVLLQEIERFEGVCILATNRDAQLDAALERRLSLKVAFPRPDRASRREIFARMLPSKLPLQADVDIDSLATHDLSGGEIKNIVLNAARKALVRDGASARVGMHDFQSAIAELTRGRRTARVVGFRQSA